MQRAAEAEDMATLGTQGLKKVREGLTSLEEILGVIMGGGE
jgi:type II secretory ATPase GspE/PulE/Tfp pilus assembly ATPase PilB-like protein